MEELLVVFDDQEIDFVKTTVKGKQYLKEEKKLMCFTDDLGNLLADNGCWIAGGAVTSVFTGKEINDIDVYFPSKEAFSNVMAEIFDGDVVSYGEARLIHVTNKSILLQSDGQDVQFIVFKFFNSVEDIFASFDFTAVMGAFSLREKTFHLHPEFLQHNAQRFLKFNSGTDYPMISMLRVDKYRERGYTTSKQEMLRVALAIAAKNFDSWDKMIDEVGSMYGMSPDEIFDTTKPFSLEEASKQMENIFIPKHYKTLEPPSSLHDLAKKMPEKMSQNVLDFIQSNEGKDYWNRPKYFEWLEKKDEKPVLESNVKTKTPSPNGPFGGEDNIFE